MTPKQRKANRRLALILLTVAIAFGVGFVVKMTMFAH
ncbi:MAG TPA: cytochrome oxidase small assembly protein [Roseateles sp.]|nr:cytochrome oxidase small assembly protein [Roseateles sp.]